MWWIFLPKLIQLLSECLHLSASKKRHRLQSDFAKLKFSNCSDCSNKCSLQFTNSLRIWKLSKRVHNLKKQHLLMFQPETILAELVQLILHKCGFSSVHLCPKKPAENCHQQKNNIRRPLPTAGGRLREKNVVPERSSTGLLLWRSSAFEAVAGLTATRAAGAARLSRRRPPLYELLSRGFTK